MRGEVKFIIKSDFQYFFFFAILIVTLLDMRCLSLTPNSIKEHLSELRTITFLQK